MFKDFLGKAGKVAKGKNEGQFVFIIGGLLLGIITLSILMPSLLGSTNVIQNDAIFSDSAKLLFALVPFIFFIGVFMILTSYAGNNFSSS